MRKLYVYIRSMFITFMIVFSLVIWSFIIIDYAVFGQNNLQFGNILFWTLIILVMSILLNLFYRINRVTIVIQVVVTYVSIVGLIYLLGYFNHWFDLDRIWFIFSSLIINMVGFISLIVFFVIRHYLQVKELNKSLAAYKEREHHEND